MGFLISRIHPLDSGSVTIETIRRLALSGKSGLFARHLPQLAKEDGTWSLSAEALIRMAEPDAAKFDAIVLEMRQRASERKILFRLVGVSGAHRIAAYGRTFSFQGAHPAGARSIGGRGQSCVYGLG